MSRSRPSTKDSPSKDRPFLMKDPGAPDAKQQMAIDYQPPSRDKGPSPPSHDQDPGEAGRKQLDGLRKVVEKNRRLVGELVEKDKEVEGLTERKKGLEEQVNKLEAEKQNASRALEKVHAESAAKDEKLKILEEECQRLRLALEDPGKALAEIMQQLEENNNALESQLAANASANPNRQKSYR